MLHNLFGRGKPNSKRKPARELSGAGACSCFVILWRSDVVQFTTTTLPMRSLRCGAAIYIARRTISA